MPSVPVARPRGRGGTPGRVPDGSPRYLEVAHVDLVVQPAQASRDLVEFLGEGTATGYQQLAAASPPRTRRRPWECRRLPDSPDHPDRAGPCRPPRRRVRFPPRWRRPVSSKRRSTRHLRRVRVSRGGRRLGIRATASAPGRRPRSTVDLAAPHGPRRPLPRRGTGDSHWEVAAFRLPDDPSAGGRHFDDDDRQFAVQVADILAAALQRLWVEEDDGWSPSRTRSPVCPTAL